MILTHNICWDDWFLREATRVAERSKDPKRKVGCVIVRPDNTEASRGYNGFPRGVEDNEERFADKVFKLAVIRHAEENAVDNARETLEGYTLYVSPYQPCAHCAGQIISKGIKRVVTDIPGLMNVSDKWKHNFLISQAILKEAGVALEFRNGLPQETSDPEVPASPPGRVVGDHVPYAGHQFPFFIMTDEEAFEGILCENIPVDKAATDGGAREDFKIIRAFSVLGNALINAIGFIDQDHLVHVNRGSTVKPKCIGAYNIIWRGSSQDFSDQNQIIVDVVEAYQRRRNISYIMN